MSFVAGADHREHRQPAGAGDTQQVERLQREGRTENRANKNALYSKTCKEEMRERRKASRTENRGRKG